MIELSAKKQWLTDRKPDADAFRELLANPALRAALTHALAHMAQQANTNDELTGAKKFIGFFTTLSDQIESQVMPEKSLKTYA